MSGRYNGMQAIILEKCQFAAFVPCAAHSLNLVGKCAAECCCFDAAALAKGYDSILEALCEIVNDADQTADARLEATGLRDRMDELETAIFT